MQRKKTCYELETVFGHSLHKGVVFVGVCSIIISIVLFISSITSLNIESVHKSATQGMKVIFALVSSSLSCYQVIVSILLLWQAIKMGGNVYLCSVWFASHVTILVIYFVLFSGKVIVFFTNGYHLNAVLIAIAGIIYEVIYIYFCIIVHSYGDSLGQERYY